GTHTYFVPDVAYHLTKWERGFTRAVNIQGSDHHGTVARVRAGLQAASSKWERAVPPGYPDYVLHKMVTVMKGGGEMKISKRAGSYVSLRELIDEVGRDAVRFFLLCARPTPNLCSTSISPSRNRRRIPSTMYRWRTHAFARCSSKGKRC